ncbi:hypothetical protein [Asanoa sp. NPDC050611]|uniref:hypothetical protein n=1 Tax=Asanoa sp. NPDC050611 TaxID=3157098 RepID=UPI0033E17D4D
MASRKPPGPVLAASILLYVGGGLTVLGALVSLPSGSPLRSALYAVYGLLYVGLGEAVRRGRRWARRAVLALCAVAVALAVARLFGGGVFAALSSLVWPTVYAVLLSTPEARSWFARHQPATS